MINKTPYLELFYYEECPYCRLVLEIIDEHQIEIQLKNIRKNQGYLEQLIKATGRRTVPCVFIDGRPMHESRDIIRWIEANRDSLKKKS